VSSHRAAPFVFAFAFLLVLAACSEPAPVAPAPGALPPLADAGPARPESGPPPAVTPLPAPSWQAAPIVVPADPQVREALHAEALAAESAERWFGIDPPGALDLHLALLASDPADSAAAAGRERVVAALGTAFDAALREGRTDEAQQLAAVLAVVDSAGEPGRQQALADLHTALALVRLGHERRAAGAWLAPRGASAVSAFREAQDLVPRLLPAREGLQSIETALLARAAAAAAAGRFDEAAQDLTRAGRLGLDGVRLQDARATLAQQRAEAAALALADVDIALQRLDLQQASRRLAQAERIDPLAPGLDERNQRLALARRYGHFQPGQRFADALVGGGSGPEMVVIPHGRFLMGAIPGENGARDNEGPPHTVRFDRGFALAVRETTVAEFARFVAATGHVTVAERRGRSTVYDERSGRMIELRGADWRRGFDGRSDAADQDPVLHVAFADAAAYAEWLAVRSGQSYRLPSEAEFEYALRAGSTGPWAWGRTLPASAAPGNLTGDGDRSPQGRRWGQPIRAWSDGAWGPAAVGSYPVEGFGTFDLIGNASEWVEDCWHDSYRRAPDDGRAWVNPGCAERVVRGGSWASTLDQARSSFRLQVPVGLSSARVGFRVARDL